MAMNEIRKCEYGTVGCWGRGEKHACEISPPIQTVRNAAFREVAQATANETFNLVEPFVRFAINIAMLKAELKKRPAENAYVQSSTDILIKYIEREATETGVKDALSKYGIAI